MYAIKDLFGGRQRLELHSLRAKLHEFLNTCRIKIIKRLTIEILQHRNITFKMGEEQSREKGEMGQKKLGGGRNRGEK